MPPPFESKRGPSTPKRKPAARGPKRAAAGPTGVADILSTLEKTTKLGQHLEHAKIWEHWEEIAGPTVAKYCQPKTVRDGELVIEAESAVWMHKVNFKKWQIIKRINMMARKELVHSIFVLLFDPDADDERTSRRGQRKTGQ